MTTTQNGKTFPNIQAKIDMFFKLAPAVKGANSPTIPKVQKIVAENKIADLTEIKHDFIELLNNINSHGALCKDSSIDCLYEWITYIDNNGLDSDQDEEFLKVVLSNLDIGHIYNNDSYEFREVTEIIKHTLNIINEKITEIYLELGLQDNQSKLTNQEQPNRSKKNPSDTVKNKTPFVDLTEVKHGFIELLNNINSHGALYKEGIDYLSQWIAYIGGVNVDKYQEGLKFMLHDLKGGSVLDKNSTEFRLATDMIKHMISIIDREIESTAKGISQQDNQSKLTNQIGKKSLQKVKKGFNGALEKLKQAKKNLFQREKWQENDKEVTFNDSLKQREDISKSLSCFRANGKLSSEGINNLLEVMYHTLSYKLDHPDIKSILDIRNVRKMYDRNSPDFKEVSKIMKQVINDLNDKLTERLVILEDNLLGLLKAIQHECKVDKKDLHCLHTIAESHKVVFSRTEQKDIKLLLNSLKSGESYDKNSYSYRFHKVEGIIEHALRGTVSVKAQIKNPTFIANDQSQDLLSGKMSVIESIQKCNQLINR